MADKYIRQNAGDLEEVEGTVTSTGVSEAGDIPALDSNGKLDTSLLPTGVGAEVKVLASDENLTAGDYVNIFNDTGTEKVRLADASNGRHAHGFVKDNVTSPANATVYLEGINDDLSGLTPGAQQFLSADTPGAGVETADATSGEYIQKIGVALSATEVSFEGQQPILLA